MKQWILHQVAEGDVDILHNHGMWQVNLLYAAHAARRGKVALVWSPRGSLSSWAMQHGSVLKKLFWPLLQEPALRSSTCFHATAESEYEDIRRLGFKQPVAVIPNGIDIPAPKSQVAAEDRTLLFLGRLHSVKGLENLLSAWKVVQDEFPQWKLDIVGRDDTYGRQAGYLETLKDLSNKNTLTRITFVGELNGEQKLEAYRNAELYVLPTHSENFGITVAESLAAGTPAIVTKGAPWSGLEQCGAGWHIEIGVQPLIDCLRVALALPRSQLFDMGKAGREWMMKHNSWAILGTEMLSTYQWLARQNDPPPPHVRLD